MDEAVSLLAARLFHGGPARARPRLVAGELGGVPGGGRGPDLAHRGRPAAPGAGRAGAARRDRDAAGAARPAADAGPGAVDRPGATGGSDGRWRPRHQRADGQAARGRQRDAGRSPVAAAGRPPSGGAGPTPGLPAAAAAHRPRTAGRPRHRDGLLRRGGHRGRARRVWTGWTGRRCWSAATAASDLAAPVLRLVEHGDPAPLRAWLADGRRPRWRSRSAWSEPVPHGADTHPVRYVRIVTTSEDRALVARRRQETVLIISHEG